MLPLLAVAFQTVAAPPATFSGRFYAGTGDVEFLQLLDTSRRVFSPDPELQTLDMFYTPAWNGFVEGPTWGAWWIQNSYGPTYCELPFIDEPYTTFLQNSQDLWFDQMGDGQRKGFKDWVAPDGCLCDAAAPGWIVYRQGDGRVDIHDWGMEFTAAGLLMQAELLLISRDRGAVDHYLPRLERCANFLDARRDPATNLYLAGAAGNLLAPSYAGYKKPDGTYDKAYLAGLSVTTIAALNRLIELERFAGRAEQAALYAGQRELAVKGLPQLLTPDGCFIKSLDPDGTRHGVFGAEKYGYFEAVPNHDAVCFRVVDDPQAERICNAIAAIPGLRPHDLIITNYPSLDDMYEQPAGLWGFGTWVNGGHWSTCEARMIMAWYRVGRPEEARKAMEAYLRFARQFRIDNPLVEFGGAPYQPKEPINTVYDTIGIPAAMVRGLFEYLYSANALTLVPHVPAGITALEQRFPVRFGEKRIWLSTFGSGPVTGVTVNGKPLTSFNHEQVKLAYQALPAEARVAILLGGAKPVALPKPAATPPVAPPAAVDEDRQALGERATQLRSFIARVGREGLGARYEVAHAKLAVEFIDTVSLRARRQADGTLKPLAEPASQQAADQLYLDTATKLCDGFEKAVQHYRDSTAPAQKRIFQIWRELSPAPGWTNIRSMGAKQTFRKHEGAWRMSLDGQADASCGWAWDLPEALVLPDKARLLIRLNGSPGARFFADLMTPDGKPVFQTGWQATPEQPVEGWFDLPAGATLSQVILYAQTPGGPVWNDFREVSVRAADGKVLCAPVK